MNLRRKIKNSDSFVFKSLRVLYLGIRRFSIPSISLTSLLIIILVGLHRDVIVELRTVGLMVPTVIIGVNILGQIQGVELVISITH